MPIAVNCRCGKKMSVRDELAGRKGKCPACGTVLAVPALASAKVPVPSPVAPAAPRPASPVPKPAGTPKPTSKTTTSFLKPQAPESASAAKTLCPVCGAPVKAQEIFCVKCGASVEQRQGSTLKGKKRDVTTTFRKAAAPRWKGPLIGASVVVALLGVLGAWYQMNESGKIREWRRDTQDGAQIKQPGSVTQLLRCDPREQKSLARMGIDGDIDQMSSLFFANRKAGYEHLCHLVDLASVCAYRPDRGWWARRADLSKLRAWWKEGRQHLYWNHEKKRFAILPKDQRVLGPEQGS